MSLIAMSNTLHPDHLSATERLAEITEILAKKELIDRFTGELGMEMPSPGRKGLQEYINRDRALWAPAVKASGVKFE